MPFDANKFNFTKIKDNEILLKVCRSNEDDLDKDYEDDLDEDISDHSKTGPSQVIIVIQKKNWSKID